MPRPLRTIYQIKVSLKGAKPPIWRRILIPSSMDLSELHAVLQVCMDWDGSHLHQFTHGKQHYGIVDAEFDDGTHNEDGVRISSLLKAEKDHLDYTYDFGDNWLHKLELEKILPFHTEQKLPQCIAGRRHSPPDDIGGIWGYLHYLEVMQDPSHPEYEELEEWHGELSFKPAEFNIQTVNQQLKK